MYRYKCNMCGASLDPQETCTECEEKIKAMERPKNHFKGMLIFENDGQLRFAAQTKK